MAKYTVTFSCGHTEVIELVGKTSERERKIAYFEQYGTCSECYKAEQEVKRAAAIEAVKAANLPELAGSVKQIAWAEKIRAQKFNEFNGKGFNFIVTETSAAWWIENRNSCESVIIARSRKAKVENLANMSKSEMFKRAHKLAKKVKTAHPETNYSANFAIALKEIYAAVKSLKKAA